VITNVSLVTVYVNDIGLVLVEQKPYTAADFA
jgi:hypothetical protein